MPSSSPVPSLPHRRCPRCFPGTIDFGCDQLGHTLSHRFAREGWLDRSLGELRLNLEDVLHRMRGVGPVGRARVIERLSGASTP